jgi:RpiB/LacA/LacB family sugar-phosphate isomerase
LKIALAADHAGYELKESLGKELRDLGHQVLDLGTCDPGTPSDYPDFAEGVGQALKKHEAERGIIVCGSGVGVSVAANKIVGIRAAICHDTYSARQGVEHDDMNVLCLGARVIGSDLARELVRAFLNARFSGEERHVRRLKKVLAIEDRAGRPGG